MDRANGVEPVGMGEQPPDAISPELTVGNTIRTAIPLSVPGFSSNAPPQAEAWAGGASGGCRPAPGQLSGRANPLVGPKSLSRKHVRRHRRNMTGHWLYGLGGWPKATAAELPSATSTRRSGRDVNVRSQGRSP